MLLRSVSRIPNEKLFMYFYSKIIFLFLNKGYVSVLSRPMAEKNVHDPIWSSVYVDSGVSLILFVLFSSQIFSLDKFAQLIR
jgi:hypothetical protein